MDFSEKAKIRMEHWITHNNHHQGEYELLRENFDKLEEFIATNPKGKKLMEYYLMIESEFENEHEQFEHHLARMEKMVEEIKRVINAQQKYTEIDSFSEKSYINSIIDDALELQSELIRENQISVVKNYHHLPPLPVQRAILEATAGRHVLHVAFQEDNRVAGSPRPLLPLSCLPVPQPAAP